MKKVVFSIFLVGIFVLDGPFCLGQENKTTLGFVSGNLPDNIVLKIGDAAQNLPKAKIVPWLKESVFLAYSPHYNSEIENTDFCAYKKSVACRLSFRYENFSHIQKQSVLSFDEASIKKFIGELAYKTDKPPEDARLKIEDGKVSVFSLGTKGSELDQDKSSELLLNYFKEGDYEKPLYLPFNQIDPEIPSVDSISDLGVDSLIGEGVSNFRGSPKNRIFNINVATKRFNGVLIKPGEEFSFVKVLGEVDGEHGYLPELVIKKDKTEPEFGGGICQVSTTAFRAAINSGLEITARRNHAYPVSYYNPQGMDATVYVPRPDLRFINDTPNYILIQTKIEGTILTFDFYGTSDGRKTEITGPKIVERNPDGSMKTTFTQSVTDKEGNIIRKDVFNSNYDSPSKYPHPGTTNDVLTQKPNGWSDNEWSKYKKAHGL